MPYRLHRNARLTPHQRRYIQLNPEGLSARELAEKFGVSVKTVYKWMRRKDVEDAPYGPRRPRRALDDMKRAVIAFLRQEVGLSGDDILRLIRECLGWKVSRATLYRTLKQMGLTGTGKEQRQWKKFEEVEEPGFLHADVYHMPRIGKRRRYLFVAIDRATRCAWVMMAQRKDSRSAVRFIHQCVKVFPFKINTVLTDNGKEFTDAYTRGRKKPSGNHPFDKACKELGITHRLTKPYKPQTNGMVERLIGKIETMVTRKYTASSHEDLFGAIARFLLCYHYTYHSALKASPIEKLKQLLPNSPSVNSFEEKLKNLADHENAHHYYNVNNSIRHDTYAFSGACSARS